VTARAATGRTAHRQRQFHSARDFETSSSQIGDIEPFSEQLRRKAQLVIAGNAKGRSRKAQVADAEAMMRMLGIHPDQPIQADPLAGTIPSFQMRSNR
jgi:hypothetical protein